MISRDLPTAPGGETMPHRRVPAWLGYAAMLLVVIAGVTLLSLVIGERTGIGRIVWLLVGLLLGSVWSFRQRLPLLNSGTTLVAVGGWSGLILAGILTLAFAPTTLPSAVSLASETARNSNGALRPAPPTAVRRTGTVGPTPRPACTTITLAEACITHASGDSRRGRRTSSRAGARRHSDPLGRGHSRAARQARRHAVHRLWPAPLRRQPLFYPLGSTRSAISARGTRSAARTLPVKLRPRRCCAPILLTRTSST